MSSSRISAHRTVIVDLLNGVLGNEKHSGNYWIDGELGSERCSDGSSCTDGKCKLAHPASWKFHQQKNDGTGTGLRGIVFWKEVKAILVDKFGDEALTIEESLDGFDLRQALPNNGLIVLINRLQVMGCFSLKSDALGQLQSLPRRRARFHAKGQQVRSFVGWHPVSLDISLS